MRTLTKDLALVAGRALLLFVGIDVLLGSALLVLGVTVGPLLLPAAAAAAVAATLALHRGLPREDLAAGVLLAVAVAAASVAVATSFVDMSYDGNSYQKVAMGALAHGWNPVYESIDAYYLRSPVSLSPVTHALWADHYPKASWVFGSSAYALVGNIEAGKSINLVMGAAMALLLWHYLRSRFLGAAGAGAVSALAAVNPITLPQYLTNYVDGLLACTLFAIIAMLVARADERFCQGRGAAADAALAAAVLACVNIKFTGFVYAGFFCGSFWVLELVRSRLSGGSAALGRTFARRTGYYLAVVAVSVLVAGSNSYVRNAVDHGSPFYPLISSQQVDIIEGYQPDSFASMNPYKQFALSALSKTSNLWKEDVQLKVPFTFSADELSVSVVDARRAGFGAFSSGIFLVSGVACLVGCAVLWRRDRAWLGVAAAFVVPSVALVGLTDGSWWARYTPYLWLVPCMALVMLLGAQGPRPAARRVLGAALALVMAVDVLTFVPAVQYSASCTREYREFSQGLLARGEEVSVTLTDAALGGVLYNLRDDGVDYRYVPGVEGEASQTLGFVGLVAAE